MKNRPEQDVLRAWQELQNSFQLNERQMAQFKQYMTLLLKWNEEISLTTITQPYHVIQSHFFDSLKGAEYITEHQIKMIADIGSGPGFPGIPLKILFPHLNVVLIEVTGKKIAFLKEVIQALELEGIEIYTLDWRTFLRKATYPIDLFVTRAALEIEELLRVYKPSSPYKHVPVIYWASHLWNVEPRFAQYVAAQYPYNVGNKSRKLVLFKPVP